MKTAAIIHLATAAVLGVIAVVMAWYALPIYAGDAACFMPAAINQAAGHGLVNHFYTRGDPTGADRMVWHGFLMPLLYGHLLFKPTYPALFLLQGLVAATVLGLAGWWFSLITASRTQRWWLGILGGLFLIGIFPFLFNGRPEPLVMLLMLGTMIGIHFAGKGHHWWIIGFGLGLIGTAQPGVAVLAALLACAYICLDHPWKSAMPLLAKIGAVAAAVTLLLTATVYPYGIGDWIAGLRHHGSIVLGQYHAHTTWSNRFNAWFWHQRNFMVGMWYLLAIVAATPLMWRCLRLAAWRTGFVIASLGLLVVAWEIGVKAPTVYNLIVFAPLVCGAILLLLDNEENTYPIFNPQRMPAWRRVGLPLAAMAIAAMPVIGFAKLMAVAVSSRPLAVDYASAKAELDEFRKTVPAIAVTDVAFSLCDNQANAEMLFMEDIKDYWRLAKADVLVVAQDQRPSTRPDEIPGFRLIRDHFSAAPRLFGVRVGATPMGYNFAVYERIKSPAAEEEPQPALSAEKLVP